jgi:hypothetical protein
VTPSDLHWPESLIEAITVSDRELRILASQLLVYGTGRKIRAELVFRGVARARCEVTEYVGDPKAPAGFKKPYVVEKVSPVVLPDTQKHGLEGITAFPPVAWIDVEVEAQEVVVNEL